MADLATVDQSKANFSYSQQDHHRTLHGLSQSVASRQDVCPAMWGSVLPARFYLQISIQEADDAPLKWS